MFLFLALLDSPEEQEKFTEVYEQYRHFMWYVANQKLQDEHLAEDAVQEAFLALTRHLDQIEDVHSPRTKKFLATVVRSKAVDILRRLKPEEELNEQLSKTQAEEDVLEQFLTRENYNHLVSCILELDDRYRVVFEYKYIYHMGDAQIGDILGISAKNVNIRYFRARKKLQKMIQKEADRFAKA
ncbi:MAG: sigma-70 family RNA polymerase sigma factor [Lachnospiraceae bacterium]|nr:sigma-70 family RNA polymerase sigma factor [Lachnospiraceae bacterium]